MENISMDVALKSLRENYQKGEFTAVKDLLLQSKAKFGKGEFHFNLGTVYSKMGNYAVGRYHLEKALIEGYGPVAVKHNLKNVQNSLGVHDITTSKSFDDILMSKSLSYNSDAYLFLSLLILFIGLVLYAKKIVNRYILTMLVLISFAPVSVYTFYLKNLNVGIVFKTVDVYEGASAIFEKTGKIPMGAKLIMGQSTNGWFFVERPLDYVGWIKSNDVGVLR